MFEGELIGAGLTHGPAFAAGHGFVEFVTSVVEAGIDQYGSALFRLEGKLFDGCNTRFVEDRTLPPGLAAIGGEQEERIARGWKQSRTGNPAVLEIDELN